MKKHTCIVVEDEPLALDRMVEYVQRMPLLDLAASFDNAAAAFAFLKTHDVDVIFLDIRLGGWSGIQMLETGAVRAKVVLTTAHQEYAAKAFDLAVVDYLVKPFSFERFVKAVDRVVDAAAALPVPRRDAIFVKTEQRLEKVPLSDLLVIEGQRDYRRIHTTTRRIMTLQTFAEFERQLAPEVMCRVHKSYMVALDRIDIVERGTIRIGNLSVPISDSYRDRFLAAIGHQRRASSG